MDTSILIGEYLTLGIRLWTRARVCHVVFCFFEVSSDVRRPSTGILFWIRKSIFCSSCTYTFPDRTRCNIIPWFVLIYALSWFFFADDMTSMFRVRLRFHV